RRETEEIGSGGSRNGLAQRHVQIVAIVEISAAGAISEILENGALRGLGGYAKAALKSGGADAVAARVSNVPRQVRSVQAAGIYGIDHNARTVGAINEIRAFGEKRGKNKAWRDENKLSLAGHSAEPAHGVFHVAIGVFGGRISSIKGLLRTGFGHGTGQCRFRLIAFESALNGILDGDCQGLGVILVGDHIGLVVADVGAGMKTTAVNGTS